MRAADRIGVCPHPNRCPAPSLDGLESWWRQGSVHRAAWPTAAELTVPAPQVEAAVLDTASTPLRSVRRAKSAAKASMATEVASLTVRGPASALALVREIADDLTAAGHVTKLDLAEDATATDLAPTVTL